MFETARERAKASAEAMSAASQQALAAASQRMKRNSETPLPPEGAYDPAPADPGAPGSTGGALREAAAAAQESAVNIASSLAAAAVE